MRARFILSETWTSLRRNVSMILSVMLVTFISFLFIGASVLLQAQITRAKGDWYNQVEVVVWLCPDGTSQAASCAAGVAPTDTEIVQLQDLIRQELGDDVSQITYVSREDFYNDTFLQQYPDGTYQGRTLTAADMQDSLRLKLTDPTKYQVVSEVLSGRTGVEEVRGAGRGDGGGRHPADRHHDPAERRLPEERDRNHASGGCLELDDPAAIRVGGRGGLVPGIHAGLRCAERAGEGVHHRLACAERAVDAVHHAADRVADRAGAGGGCHGAVRGGLDDLAASVPEGLIDAGVFRTIDYNGCTTDTSQRKGVLMRAMGRAKVATGMVACMAMLVCTAVANLTWTPAAEAVPSMEEYHQAVADHADLKAQLAGVNEDLANTILQLNDLTENQIPAAVEAADQAQQAADQAQSLADATAERLEAARQDRENLEEKIAQTGEDYDDAKDAVAQLARESFHGSTASDLMSVVTNSTTTDEFVGRMQSQAAVARSEANAAADAAGELGVSMNRKERLAAIEDEIAQLKTQADQQAASAAKAAAEAQDRQDDLQALREQGEAARQKLESQSDQLTTQEAREAADIVAMKSEIDSWAAQQTPQAAPLPLLRLAVVVIPDVRVPFRH